MSFQKLGSEIVVNQLTDGFQGYSAIATDTEGNFIVMFQDHSSGRTEVYRRLFDAEGNPITDALASGSRTQPSVALDANGNWISASTFTIGIGSLDDITLMRGSGSSIIYQRGYANTTTLSNQNRAAIARNAQGETVVVWQSLGQDGDQEGIYARRYNALGQALTDEIPVNTLTVGSQLDADVAIDSQGNFVVVWSSQNDVYIRRFNANGQALDAEDRLVNQTTLGYQGSAKIAIDPSGNFMVTWESPQLDGEGYNIYARQFRANGSALGNEFQVNTTVRDEQSSPDIAADAQGNFVITWTSQDSSGEYDVYARRFRADGTPLSGEMRVNTFTEGFQGSPAIAMQPDGDFVISWNGNSYDGSNFHDVYAQRFEIASQVAFARPRVQVSENGQEATLILQRLNDLQLTTEVEVSLGGGTAREGQDFRFAPQRITFNPGESQKSITIPILQDGRFEGNETIRLNLVAGDRAITNNRSSAIITIRDDDNRPPIVGTPQRDILTGTQAADTLVGMAGNDRLNGAGGNDTLIGVSPSALAPGRGEVDQLVGGLGQDVMVLGNANQAFYNDGQLNNRGLQDYALIRGFNSNQDKIQLHGQASDYILGTVPNQVGQGIFLKTGGAPELIAVVQGNSLTLNSSAIQFVG